MKAETDIYPFGPAYRPCVGIMVLNATGQVFAGKRSGATGEYAWQMPQGGIDPDETPEQAAWRELAEETSITQARLLAEHPEWLRYDLPQEALARRKGKYIGQAQKWFLFRFLGRDSHIDLNAHEEIEFSDWQWQAADNLLSLVIPFKRLVYENVIEAFRPHFLAS